VELLKSLLTASPLIPLFLCLALGYAIGRIKFGTFQLGGIVGTLFVAIVIGQVGVEVDDVLKTVSFALFIYSLGYVSGPQFFSSLGRSTLNQVHLAIFSAIVVFVTVWAVAQIFGLDKGTAAGLLAGATTESASVGTAGEALKSLGLDGGEVRRLEANIGVSYAVTYLFGFSLVVFFVSTIAPRMLGIDLKAAAAEYEKELGEIDEELDPGQEEAVRTVVVHIFRVTKDKAAGTTVADFEQSQDNLITVQQVVRRGRHPEVTPDLVFREGDRVALVGRRDPMVRAGDALGVKTGNIKGMGFVGETRDVVLTNPDLVGKTLQDLRTFVDPDLARALHITKLTRVGQALDLRPRTRLEAGDVMTLYGAPESMAAGAKEVGYLVDRSEHVDYVYLGLGIIAGVLIGMITVPIAGAPVALHTGGGCLLSGLLFGWLRSKRPTFGNLPTAAALHLRDFGLAIFVASVGLAVGPQAWALLKEQGILLPILAIIVVLVPIVSSMYYARYVLKMNPVVICGALAGLLTCTAGLNAVVARAGSETPVLGYTVPYALANVFLTLLGPVIVLSV